MKFCPRCKSSYTDETLSYCLQDGTTLVSLTNHTALPGPVPRPTEETPIAGITSDPRKAPTDVMEQTATSQEHYIQPTTAKSANYSQLKQNTALIVFLIGLVMLISVAALGIGATWFFFFKDRKEENTNTMTRSSNKNSNDNESSSDNENTTENRNTSTPSGKMESTGIAECDEYLKKIEEYLNCPNVSAESREEWQKQRYDTVQRIKEAGQTEMGKNIMASVCKQGTKAIKENAKCE